MSISHTFPDDIPVEELELYNGGVYRTIFSDFNFPWQREELYPEFDFFISNTLNKYIDRVNDNLMYLEGNGTIYNSVLPLDKVDCGEFTQSDKIGFYTTNTYQVTFNRSSIKVYEDGTLKHTITETDFGLLKSVVDVIIKDEFIYVIDGGYILKIKISTTTPEFSTFFGGYGGADSEYKYRTPKKLVFDKHSEQFFVWDNGNGVLKVYNKEFSYLDRLPISGNDFDVVDGEIFVLKSSTFEVYNTAGSLIYTVQHELPSPSSILVDDSQIGFVWIASSTQIFKYAINGLLVGEYERNRITDISRSGTSLFVITDDIVERNLDYSFTQTILNDIIYPHPLETTIIDPDEVCSDLVVNTTTKMIFDNINQLNLKIFGQFNINRDASSSVKSISIVPVQQEGLGLGCDYYVCHDEIVSCHALQRVFDYIFDLQIKTRDRLLGQNIFELSDGGESEPIHLEFYDNTDDGDYNGQSLSIVDSGLISTGGTLNGNFKLKTVTFRKGSENTNAPVVYLGVFRGSDKLGVSNNYLDWSDTDQPEGTDMVFDFTNVSGVYNLNDTETYKFRFLTEPSTYQFLSVRIGVSNNPTDPLTSGGLLLNNGNVTSENFDACVKIDIDTSNPTGLPSEEIEQNLIPLNWTLGAQSCEGLEPQLFNPLFTPISMEELDNPVLSCHPLTSFDPSTGLSCVSQEPWVPNESTGGKVYTKHDGEPLPSSVHEHYVYLSGGHCE